MFIDYILLHYLSIGVNIMKDKENNTDFLLPKGYVDDEESNLESILINALELDRVGMAEKTFKNHRQSIRKMIPVCEKVGIYTLENLLHSDALNSLRNALRDEIKSGNLGSPSTVEAYTGKFAQRCESAGLSRIDADRLRGAFRQARKGAMQPREIEPEFTSEHLKSLYTEMESWLDAPTVMKGRVGKAGIDVEVLDGIEGYQGKNVTLLTRDRVLAFMAFQISGAIRTGSVLQIKRGDVSGYSVRYLLTKGKIDPTPSSFNIHPDLYKFVTPLLERFPRNEDRLFPRGGGSVTNHLRALMLNAGIPEHYGRLGLHRVRKSFIKANYESGVTAGEASAGLGNTPGVAERSYATHTRSSQANKSRQAWMDALSETLVDPPEWKFEDNGIPWNRLPDWASKEDPFDSMGIKYDLSEGTDTSELKCMWRLRYVLVKQDDDGSDWWENGWRRYGAYESVMNDVVIPWHTHVGMKRTHYLNGMNVSAYKPLWLNRGGMAEKWWACLDLNQGLLVPNQQA